MRKLRPLVLLTCIIATTAFGGTLATADTSSPCDQSGLMGGRGHGNMGQRGHRYFKKMARQLGLTDQQRTQAKALVQSAKAQNRPLFESLLTARHDLRILVRTGGADEAAIRAQAAKVATAEADLAVQRAQGTRQFLALLTPEQVTKLKAIQAKQDLKYQKFVSCKEAAAEVK